MVDPQRLRVFRAVVQAGSINGAAARLGYTPSAVSQHVSMLQRETGLVLVERQGRGILPTAAGIAVADRASRVLDQLADFEHLADDLRSGRSGVLRIGTFHSANRAWMPGILASVLADSPDLRIELSLAEFRGDRGVDLDLDVFIAESVRGDVDPAVADGAAEGYDVEHLRTEDYLAVVPVGHALAARAAVTLDDLRDEAFIDNDIARGPCREIVLTACAARGFAPDFRVAAPDYPTAFDYAAAGIGVTVLPRLGAFRLPDGVVAVPIADDDVRRRIMLRVKRTMRTHPAVRRTADLIRAQAAA
ncbi:LysR family transcriptional regulator [Agromyces sp. CFH 90414]|uniref:LysR family transcriptional regulator n=1 Tax=Agromyces agglutinans TaxID=2662258 RepID=A0A6I2F2T6_9MICO|nr:LysR family transcriptional regulator [Agromyces agglutinans]MRG58849.1 LysR family transcriptional regulator [Agromyces agglutinans]